MKNSILMLVVLFSIKSVCQDSLKIPNKNLHSQIFSLSPISKKVDKVNGLVLGVGHVENKNIKNQTINGFNIEANPAPIAGMMFGLIALAYLPEIIFRKANKKDSLAIKVEPNFEIENWKSSPNLKLNGINISSGCFFTATSINGINISLGNKFVNLNGISIAPLCTISDKQNGISIGLMNGNNNLKGASIGVYNQSKELNGIQIGAFNQVKTNSGFQIGIYNRAYSKGFQIGFWNKNTKRSFALINW